MMMMIIHIVCHFLLCITTVVHTKSIIPITSRFSSTTAVTTTVPSPQRGGNSNNVSRHHHHYHQEQQQQPSSSSLSSSSSLFLSSDDDVSNFSTVDELNGLKEDIVDEKYTETGAAVIAESTVRYIDASSDTQQGEGRTTLEGNGKKTPSVPIISTTTTTTTLEANGGSTNRSDLVATRTTIITDVTTPSLTTTTTTTTTTGKNTIFICTIAILSGFGEVCALKSFGCFTNMVTGATIRFATSIAEGHYHAIRIPLCVITGYLFGIILGRILKNYIDTSTAIYNTTALQQQQEQPPPPISTNQQQHKQRNPSCSLLQFVGSIVLPLFIIPDIFKVVFYQIGQTGIRTSIIIPFQTLLQAIGYGLIAQVMNDVLVTPTTTYVVTGHFTTISKVISDRIIHRINHNRNEISLQKQGGVLVLTKAQILSTQIITSFIIGAIAASTMYQFCTFLLPIQHSMTGILLVLTLFWYSIQL